MYDTSMLILEYVSIHLRNLRTIRSLTIRRHFLTTWEPSRLPPSSRVRRQQHSKGVQWLFSGHELSVKTAILEVAEPQVLK